MENLEKKTNKFATILLCFGWATNFLARWAKTHNFENFAIGMF